MTIQILAGDCIDMMAEMEPGSVHCVVTSPPYWHLRDYGVEGQIGLEDTPGEYVEKLVEVFRHVWRVLRDDGVMWVNLGDCYGCGGNGSRDPQRWPRQSRNDHRIQHRKTSGVRIKDLVGIPWRVALGLQAAGWYLRQEITWCKRNGMPESTTDRPTSMTEKVFLLTKQPRYFYDAEAVRVPGAIPAGTRAAKGSNVRSDLKDVNGRPPEYWDYTGTRNLWNYWLISTKPYKDAHFATFPPEIPETCIKAGTSEHGCCPECGAPWERIVESIPDHSRGEGLTPKDNHQPGGGSVSHESPLCSIHTTTGWRPTCTCDAGSPIPCTVLDPFGGAGTTGLVADRLGRDAVLIELKQEYAEMARHRIKDDCPLFPSVAEEATP